jgi:poly [ADP-ribose] polymerase 10/14/15
LYVLVFSAAAYGRGVYFARDFAYSASATYYLPDANGVKYIYQCLVLTGEFTLGKRWLVDPPEKTNGEKYDSTVNNQAQPTVFVIYSDTQAYPQYLVSFK